MAFARGTGKRAVLCKQYGGFDLSDAAKLLWFVLYSEDLGTFTGSPKTDPKRDDPRLIAVVEELGRGADGDFAELEIIDIPDHVKSWHVCEDDGFETIHEDHWQA